MIALQVLLAGPQTPSHRACLILLKALGSGNQTPTFIFKLKLFAYIACAPWDLKVEFRRQNLSNSIT